MDSSTTDDPIDDSAGTSGMNGEPGDPPGCVEGALGCQCLEGLCQGSLSCVDDVCVIGPQINIGDDRAVIGGVRVTHEAEVMADSFRWSQESGPPVEILGADSLKISVSVPADAPTGELIRLRLEATRNGVTQEKFWTIEVLDSVFENALPEIADPMQLGTTEGIAFGPSGMYVVSLEGFVSLFDGDGQFVERYEVAGLPVGANFEGENLIIANREVGMGRVEQLNSNSGNLSILFNTLVGDLPIGSVNYPLPDEDGNLFVTTHLEQTVLRYDGDQAIASVFLSHPALVNPNALAWGPEEDAIYVGTTGHVWRVPILDGGGAGDPEDYLVVGDDTDVLYEVDGLAFDESANLWVGCPNAGTLVVAPYSASGPTQVARRFVTPAPGLSGFVNIRFGGGPFDERKLYYTNLTDGTVGQLRVGMRDL